MVEFSIPFVWRDEFIDFLEKQKIKEVYGTISEIGHGRQADRVESISREEAIRLRKKLKRLNIEFAYLLNAAEYNENNEKMGDFLDWLMESFKPDSITIASEKLICDIRKKYPEIKINISTIAGIKTINEIQQYEKYQPEKIVLHHDCSRNLGELKKIITYLQNRKIKAELMLNESCLYQCSKRKDHYVDIARGEKDLKYHIWCNTNKLCNPHNFLMSGYILPQMVALYERYGIANFKLTGRSRKVKWIMNATEAYIVRDYKGNLFEILATDERMNLENIVYLDTHEVKKIIEKLLYVSEKELYAKKYIMELFEKHYFYALSKVKYNIIQGELQGKVEKNIYE